MFVCLFVSLLYSYHSRIFHSYRDVTMIGKGLQTLTYAQHPLSHWTVKVLLRATPTMTRDIRLIRVISKYHDTYLCSRAFWGSYHYMFYDLGLLRLKFEHSTFTLQDRHSNTLGHHCGHLTMNNSTTAI